MRLRLDYPAIVSGRHANGAPRHILCRVPGEFEIPEYTLAELDVPFTVLGGPNVWKEDHIATIEGQLFRRFELYQPFEEAFAVGGNFWRHLYQTQSFNGFAGLEENVRVAAKELDNRVENLHRPVTRAERRFSWTERSMGCFKAPALKNWSWIDQGTPERVVEWKRKAEVSLSNFALVDGAVWKRCHEPTLELHLRPEPHSYIKTSDRGLYQPRFSGPVFDGEGMIEMAPVESVADFHVFSALDVEAAMDFAGACGLTARESDNPITVNDPSAVSDDYTVLEAVRFARKLLGYCLALVPDRQPGNIEVPLSEEVGHLKEAILLGQSGLVTAGVLHTRMENAVKMLLQVSETKHLWHANMVERFGLRLDGDPVHLPSITL